MEDLESDRHARAANAGRTRTLARGITRNGGEAVAQRREQLAESEGRMGDGGVIISAQAARGSWVASIRALPAAGRVLWLLSSAFKFSLCTYLPSVHSAPAADCWALDVRLKRRPL